MIFYQVLTIIVLASVSFIPRLLDPKIPFIIYGYAVLLLPLFAKEIKKKEVLKSLPAVFFMLFLLFTSISTLFSNDKNRSLISLGLYFSYFVVFISIRRVFESFAFKKILAKAIIAGSVILSAVFAYNTLVRHYVDRSTEGVSFQWIYFGHSHLSALLILTISVAVFLLVKAKKRSKALWFSVLVFLSITLIMTLSRFSLMSLAGAFVILWLWKKKFNEKKRVFIAVGGVTVIIFLVWWLSLSGLNGVEKYFHFAKDPRVVYWQTGINNFLKYPLTGSGLDTFKNVSMPNTNPPVLKTFYTHNFFIQMLSDAGIFAFLSAFVLIFAVFKNGFSRVSRSSEMERIFYTLLMIGLLASGFNNMVDFDWQLPTVFLTFWLIAGII